MALPTPAHHAIRILGAAATGLVVTVGLATSAHAANQGITVTCSGGAPVFSPSAISVGVADTVTLLNSTGGNLNITNGPSGTGLSWTGGPTWANTTSKVLTVTSTSGTGVDIVGPAGCSGTSTLSFGSGSGDTTAAVSAPAPIFQQFGRPVTGSCEAAAQASLNWSGVASGGWSESWAQWMNGGNGGAVCTRTLVFSTSTGAWTVG